MDTKQITIVIVFESESPLAIVNVETYNGKALEGKFIRNDVDAVRDNIFIEASRCQLKLLG